MIGAIAKHVNEYAENEDYLVTDEFIFMFCTGKNTNSKKIKDNSNCLMLMFDEYFQYSVNVLTRQQSYFYQSGIIINCRNFQEYFEF